MDVLRDYAREQLVKLSPRRKRLANFRARWGRLGNREDFYASCYHELAPRADPHRSIDEKTWVDLEFPALFSRIDTTVTTPGRQVLYHWLRTCVDDSALLERRYAMYERLRHDRKLREGIQLHLARLDWDGAQDVCRYLFDTLPEPGRYQRVLQLWAVLSIAVIVLAVPLSLPAWLFIPVLDEAATRQKSGFVESKM